MGDAMGGEDMDMEVLRAGGPQGTAWCEARSPIPLR